MVYGRVRIVMRVANLYEIWLRPELAKKFVAHNAIGTASKVGCEGPVVCEHCVTLVSASQVACAAVAVMLSRISPVLLVRG